MQSSAKTGLHWLIPTTMALFLSSTAVLGKPFRYSIGNLAILAALYLLLALVIYLPAVMLLRRGKPLGLLATAAGGFLLLLHFREQTRPSGTAESLDKPEVLAAFVAGWALVTVLYFVVLLALQPGEEKPAAGLILMAVLPLLLGSLALSHFGSNTLRWHLLRHNTFLGALSYHLFAEDTASVRAALWEAGAQATTRASEPPLPTEPVVDGAPNIVFVLIDTLRADAVAAGGGTGGSMPFLDLLATKAFVFTDVKTNSSWTFPSMASFFTGLLPEEHGGVWASRLGEDNRTLAEALGSRAYRTAGFIANRAWMRRDRGMAQGFEVFEELGTGGSIYPRAEEVNRAVLDWLSGVETDARPEFLYVHYMDPHVPYLTAGVVDPASHPAARAAYESDLRYLDDQLRDLVDALHERLDGPTWLLITADHGEEFGEHGERGHGRALYDEVLRVPALLYRFGDSAGQILDDKLEGRDFFSLLDMLSFLPALDIADWAAAHARSERYASTYYTNRSPLYHWLRPYRAAICLRAIEKDGYTLIWSGQGNTYELYDMRSDPRQLRNVADQRPEVVDRLAAAMDAAPAFWTRQVELDLSPADLERLRALGYLR